MFDELPSDCLGSWFPFIIGQGKRADKALLKACVHPAARHTAVSRPFYGDVRVDLVEVMDSDDEPLANLLHPTPVVETFPCDICGHVLYSKKALHMHAAVLHAKMTAVRRYVDSTHCTTCGLEFHSRPAILAHLIEKSPVCLANVLMQEPVFLKKHVRLLMKHVERYVLIIGRGCDRNIVLKYHVFEGLGPYLPVYGLNGDLLVASNGHPLSSNHPWHRSPDLSGGDDSLTITGCPASLREACTEQCCLCRGQG